MTAFDSTLPGYDERPCRNVGVALFFTPELSNKRGWRYPQACREACGLCPVRAACLEDALAGPAAFDQGFRAGLNEEQRVQIRRHRRRTGAA